MRRMGELPRPAFALDDSLLLPESSERRAVGAEPVDHRPRARIDMRMPVIGAKLGQEASRS